MVIEKGLGFDATGNLYGIGSNTLVAVDKLTGAMNAISPLNVDRMEDIAVRPENGIMYGLGYPNYDLYQINLASAALTKVGPSFARPSGVAFTSLPSPIGDFNSDLIVDAADYAAWRKRFGTTYSQSDYDVWRAHFGQTKAPGSGSALHPRSPNQIQPLFSLSPSPQQRCTTECALLSSETPVLRFSLTSRSCRGRCSSPNC